MTEVLIIDDEIDISESISAILQDEGLKCTTVSNSIDAINAINKVAYELIILDVWLNEEDYDGIKLLKLIKKDYPKIPVIIISGHGNIDMAVEAIKEGAYEFVEKPFKSERLILSVSRALEVKLMKEENKELKEINFNKDVFIGSSNNAVKIREIVKKIAPTTSRVLITGDSGTGKDLIAREIHNNSLFKEGPFIVVNASLLEPEGIENELFGIENDGLIKHTGLFEKANKGSLFIDEVGEMPIQTQIKILRVLTDQSFTRIGGEKEVKIETRIIASSTKNLLLAIENNTFRKDLYHRLNVVKLNLPKLADRVEDIDELILYFISKLSKKTKTEINEVLINIKKKFLHYDWPGNIRELKNVVERELIIGEKEGFSDNDDLYGVFDEKNVISMPLKNAREAFERNYLLSQIKRFNGNISKTATFIGMERSALHRKLKQLKITEVE
ncbi:sigma-54 dependent transcriptional regulator [Pelagibacteraceae bacterium]|nr:sigma-54 dependent transcriptional regulator [Pelagibacteraceae bacterium]